MDANKAQPRTIFIINVLGIVEFLKKWEIHLLEGTTWSSVKRKSNKIHDELQTCQVF